MVCLPNHVPFMRWRHRTTGQRPLGFGVPCHCIRVMAESFGNRARDAVHSAAPPGPRALLTISFASHRHVRRRASVVGHGVGPDVITGSRPQPLHSQTGPFGPVFRARAAPAMSSAPKPQDSDVLVEGGQGIPLISVPCAQRNASLPGSSYQPPLPLGAFGQQLVGGGGVVSVQTRGVPPSPPPSGSVGVLQLKSNPSAISLGGGGEWSHAPSRPPPTPTTRGLGGAMVSWCTSPGPVPARTVACAPGPGQSSTMPQQLQCPCCAALAAPPPPFVPVARPPPGPHGLGCGTRATISAAL